MTRTFSPPPRWRPLKTPLLLLSVALAPGMAGTGASPLQGQTPQRAALLAEARSELNDTRSLELLVRAADPSLAPRDSTWAVTLHDLAFTLVRLGEEEAAGLWLRWAARHAAEWPLDREWFPPAVTTLWDRARLEVASGPDDPEVGATAWEWDGAAGAGVPGRLRLGDDDLPPGTQLFLERPGEEPVPAEAGDQVEAGTYRVGVTAEGHEPVLLEREILPGVATLLDVELVPTLSEGALELARARTATIRWGEGVEQCTRGVVVGDGRSVLTSLRGLGSQGGLSVETSGEHSFSDVPVVRTDEGLELALLRLEGEVPGLVESAPAEGSQHGWVVSDSGCNPGDAVWTRLDASGSRSGGLWILRPDLPPSAVGAPLLHPDGGILGLVTREDRAIPLPAAAALIRGPFAAAEEPVLASTAAPQRSGLPWRWIGTGLGLAGIAAALAAGSGGDEGEGRSRGTVIITFPGG